MRLIIRVLVGLVIGLAAGILFGSADGPLFRGIISTIEPVGTLWTNAIRMTVIPLVISLLITGVASESDVRTIGRLGRRAVLLFLSFLAGAAALTALIGPALVSRLPISEATAAALRGDAVNATETATESAKSLPTIGDWLVALVPTNPIAAAASGSMLPLVIFSLLFALALTRIESASRRQTVVFFQAVGESMMVLVRWVLFLAPVGVFALAVPLGARAGLAVAGALVYYVGLVAAICMLFILCLYMLVAVLGRTSSRQFSRACAPAQAVAFSSRSSLASLPAMVDGANAHLGLSPAVSGFFLPLAVSTFRLSATVGIMVGSLFLARLYGVSIAPVQVIGLALTAVFLSFSAPGVPGGSILIIAPILADLGIPAAGVGILLAMDTIPDMFRTLTNVTADMAAATLVDRSADRQTIAEAEAGVMQPGATRTPGARTWMVRGLSAPASGCAEGFTMPSRESTRRTSKGEPPGSRQHSRCPG